LIYKNTTVLCNSNWR